MPLNPGNPSFSGNSWPRRRNPRFLRARVSFTPVGALIFVTVHQPAYRARLSAFLIVSARLCHDAQLVGAGSRGEATGGADGEGRMNLWPRYRPRRGSPSLWQSPIERYYTRWPRTLWDYVAGLLWYDNICSLVIVMCRFADRTCTRKGEVSWSTQPTTREIRWWADCAWRLHKNVTCGSDFGIWELNIFVLGKQFI